MAKPNPDIRLSFSEISKRRKLFTPFYDYYEGRHALNYASEKYLNKFLDRLKDLNVNLCKRVVNAPVSRLEVINFASETKEIAKKAWEIWKRSKMPLKSKEVFREAYRTGSAFVLVWQDPITGIAEFYPQKANLCKIWRDSETGKAIKAAKLWRENKRWFLTLYYPDRIEKYTTGAYFTNLTSYPTSAEIFKLRTDAGRNPMPNIFGKVPLFELAPLEGESILSDVIPINKSLNKTVADIQVGLEYNTIRQRYTAGVIFETDPQTGRPLIHFKHDDSIWSADDPEVKFGEFADVDLEKMLKVEAETKQRVAQVTGIPAHFFNLGTGDYPSGEALETAEAPFTSIVEDAQLSFGESWGEIMNFALAIELVLKVDSPVEVQWQDAGRPSLTKRLNQGVIKKSLGVSTRQVLSELGYSEQQIDGFLVENRHAATALGQTLGKLFDAGGDDVV